MNWLEGMQDNRWTPGRPPMAMPRLRRAEAGGRRRQQRDGPPDRRGRRGGRRQRRHHRPGPRQGRRHRPDAGQGRRGLRHHRRPDRPGRRSDRVRQQLADEHADATLLVNAAGVFVPKPFLDYDGADYDAYLELDRATFFLTQTVARGMVAGGRGGAIVNIGSMWAHQAIGATPSSALLDGQGRPARAHPATWPWSWPRTRSGSTRSPRPSWPPRSTRGSSPADKIEETLHSFDGFHPLGRIGTATRHGQHHHLPALPGHQLGHRRHLGRRRRRHGRPELTAQPPGGTAQMG